MAIDWKTSFVAVSAILGEPLETTLESLGEADEVCATPLVRALRGSSREARARAIAGVLTKVVAALPEWEAE